MTSPHDHGKLPLLELPPGKHTRCVGTLSLIRQAKHVELPLAAVDVSAIVCERIACVTVKQVFRNTFTEHLEALYTFPLPPHCAVSSFQLLVGKRVIKGIVKERARARQDYKEAMETGKRAALLEQERDDVFTVQVGNLPPGEEVTVVLTYSELLPFFANGQTELRLPLVVAPRYIPGTPLDQDAVGHGVELDTDAVPDASRISPPRLAPGFDPGVALDIAVEILLADGNGGMADLSCSQHAIRTGSEAGSLRISLAKDSERLNRDFILTWQLAQKAVSSSLLVYRGDNGQAYAALSILPPYRQGFSGSPVDVVFVLDRSGSMNGLKMTSAARACSILLNALSPRDRFSILAFDDRVEWFSPRLSEATSGRFFAADEAGIELGQKYLRDITARGGTELDSALAEALSAAGDRSAAAGRIPVVVLLTDGQVGDESLILKRIQKQLGDARLFTVGIDTAVNEGLLTRLAALGGGTATFVQPGTALESALSQVAREIGQPLVTELAIEGKKLELDRASIAPQRIPDLFACRPSLCFLRLTGKGSLRVTGKQADGTRFEQTVAPQEIKQPALAQLWAKARIRELEDAFRIEPAGQDKIKQEIVDLAVKHQLLTRFTAFVAVDESEIVNAGGQVKSLAQPVEMPESWEISQPGSFFGTAPPVLTVHDCWGSPIAASFKGQPGAAPAPTPAGGALDSGWGRASFEALHQFGSAQPEAGGSQWGPPGSPPPAVPQQQAGSGRGLPGDTPDQLEAVAVALESFVKALHAALAKLKKGGLPDAPELEELRRKLLTALSGMELGLHVSLMQTFLRSAAVELIASLKAPGASPPSLVGLWEGRLKALEKAEEELRSHIAHRSGAGGSAAFWETTV